MKNNLDYLGWLAYATNKLKAAGIESARLDALILIEDSVKLDRSIILARPKVCLSDYDYTLLELKLNRRLSGEPIAYIRGYTEFYGHKFMVNKNVLIPRPESEAFFELLLKYISESTKKLLDVGTGCGNLAITAKLLFPNLKVTASDISKSAIKLAQTNSKALKANIKFVESNLINSQTRNMDVILANLPYIPIGFEVSKSVLYEPKKALFCNDEGLDLIKQLAPLAFNSLNANGLILIESMAFQQPIIKNYYKNYGYNFVAKNGLIQCFQKP